MGRQSGSAGSTEEVTGRAINNLYRIFAGDRTKGQRLPRDAVGSCQAPGSLRSHKEPDALERHAASQR